MLTALAEAKKSAEAATLSAKTAQTALHTLESADVLIYSVKSSDGYIIKAGTDIIVTLKNVGRTKATDLSISAYMNAGPYSVEDPPPVRPWKLIGKPSRLSASRK